MSGKHSIYDDTPLMPAVIADSVLTEVARCLPLDLHDGGRAMADRLADRAERIYAANPDFRRKIKARGDSGRDHLYMFMRHWASSEIQKCCPRVFRQLPDSFKLGRPLKCGR